MQRQSSLSDFVYSEEELDVVRAANEIDHAQQMPGFTRIHSFMSGLVAAARDAAQAANTANPTEAIDALREWQNKADFLSQIEMYIESLRAQRDALAPRNTVEALLLKEQLNGRDSDGPDTSYTV